MLHKLLNFMGFKELFMITDFVLLVSVIWTAYGHIFHFIVQLQL